MIATIINSAAVALGALIGFFFHRRISESLKTIVFTGAGIVALVLGIKMSFETTRIVFLALSLILGGLVGEWLGIEGAILKLGEWLKRRMPPSRGQDDQETTHNFAYGFLDSSVLFCVGAMALIGSFKAGVEGDYALLLTKSVLDGFVAIIFGAALGIGVAFSALSILVYQGTLTLLARVLQPLATDLVLSELTGLGGCMVIMIGINLLGLTKIKTANYLPGLVIVLLLLTAEAMVPVKMLFG